MSHLCVDKSSPASCEDMEICTKKFLLSNEVLLASSAITEKSSTSLNIAEAEACFSQVNLETPLANRNHNADDDGILKAAECRICQEEDDLSNLETPCACTGSLKFAHRKCVQHWCNEKGDTTCEICRKPYEGGYFSPVFTRADSFSINIGEIWEMTGGQLHEPRMFTVTSEHLFSQAEYEAYTRANERSAMCFRCFAVILMILLLLRHVFSTTSTGPEEDASTFFFLFLLRTAGFFLPCYIMARALNILQSRRQRQEAALAPTEVAYLLQSGRARGVHIAVSSGLAA